MEGPMMDSRAIMDRLSHYLDQPETLVEQGQVARTFAVRFTPGRYRSEICKVFQAVGPLGAVPFLKPA